MIFCLLFYKQNTLKDELKGYEDVFTQKAKFFEEYLDCCFNPNLCKTLLDNLLTIQEPKLIVQETDLEESTSIDGKHF